VNKHDKQTKQKSGKQGQAMVGLTVDALRQVSGGADAARLGSGDYSRKTT